MAEPVGHAARAKLGIGGARFEQHRSGQEIDDRQNKANKRLGEREREGRFEQPIFLPLPQASIAAIRFGSRTPSFTGL